MPHVTVEDGSAADVRELADRMNRAYAVGAGFASNLYIYGAAPWRPADTSVHFKRASADDTTLVIETTAPYGEGQPLESSHMVFRITRPRGVTIADGHRGMRVLAAAEVQVDGVTWAPSSNEAVAFEVLGPPDF